MKKFLTLFVFMFTFSCINPSMENGFAKLIESLKQLTAKAGDNLIKVYVNALPKSSFIVELLTEDNQLLGKETFAIIN